LQNKKKSKQLNYNLSLFRFSCSP